MTGSVRSLHRPWLLAAPVSREGFERFRQHVLEDLTLQEALRAPMEVSAFLALATRLGAEHGCHFSAEELKDIIRDARRSWLGDWV